MGAFNGSLTYRQYYIKDALPEGWQDAFQEKITKHLCTPVTAETEEERSIGWCNAAFLLDLDLTSDKWHFNEYIVLGLRIDTIAVPGPLLKLYTEKEIRRLQAEQGREEINRYEKAEIKERVKIDLKRKVFPSYKTVDMVWNLEQGIMRFWSTNEKLNLEFCELFEETFDVEPILDTAYTAALHADLDLPEELIAQLPDLEPSLFAELPTFNPGQE
ncbi:MAG: recombination-associated protein RdgC [Bradymonadia bacterium]